MLLDNSLRSILRRWYTEGKISASERRVLVTKWVGKAWTEVGSNRDMVVRSLKKCGISLPLHSSKNGKIHIECIEEYELPTAKEITESEPDSKSEIEDNEDNFEVTDNCSSSLYIRHFDSATQYQKTKLRHRI